MVESLQSDSCLESSTPARRREKQRETLQISHSKPMRIPTRGALPLSWRRHDSPRDDENMEERVETEGKAR